MRKYQQVLILDMLKFCGDKHDDIRRLPVNKFDEIIDALNVCKESAENIGEFIEQVYGEGSQTVILLEEYCDLLYEMGVNRKIRVKVLNKQLFKIIDNVERELKADKIEIAFFPYKASMSDSLESIYLSAKADPQCEAYWIPVPYYERTKGGMLGRMHCDANRYPDYLQAVDWKSYDTEKRHPDIIFIHYPYDELNRVTSIHPSYYSSVLKEQTEFLVYVEYGIPYWIPREPEACSTAENVIIAPVMINCSLYVAYSQKLAECCKLALLLSKITKHMHTRLSVNKKVVPLGSPKFDKILNMKREDFTLPDGWNTIIGNRKVMLYNTSLAELLKNSEQFLEKITKVIEALSMCTDLVLWWRPHPLTLETIRSMRPELMEGYKKIVNGFKRFGRGIYDDTEDLNRAIAFSDGCMTGESSVLLLYLATGKPFSITTTDKKLPSPAHNNESTFSEPLKQRIKNMKVSKGANVGNWNCCIWWDNFLEEDLLNNVHYDNFLMRFVHYIVHMDEYPEAQEYKELQLQMLYDFVENADGTAGEKIYQYCKQRVLSIGK